jgi:uncharacterized protein
MKKAKKKGVKAKKKTAKKVARTASAKRASKKAPVKKKIKAAAKKTKAAKKPARKTVKTVKTKAAKATAPTLQNPFVWYDLMTSDVEGAKRFYREVLGWTYGLQPPDYTLCNVDGIGAAGIMAKPDHLAGMPPFWTGYIYTPDVDKTCAEIKTAGGTVEREPWDIPDMLRMAVVADSTGAYFNIMQPLTPEPEQRVKDGAIGSMGWHELMTADLPAAQNFYSSLFHWPHNSALDLGPDVGPYHLYDINGAPQVGMMKKMDFMPVSFWNYYWWVDGIDAAAARVTGAGGAITNGPMEVPGGQWVLNATDPQGGHFSLVSNRK